MLTFYPKISRVYFNLKMTEKVPREICSLICGCNNVVLTESV